jgi:hypothetical protein
LQLNSAQIGFDVIHPQLSVTITDPAQLQAFAIGSALRVNIGLDSVHSGMFELKANALSLELNRTVTSQSANIWVTHSGEWEMNRRTDGSVTTMLLRPRREVFATAAGSGILRSSIPAHPPAELRGRTAILVLGARHRDDVHTGTRAAVDPGPVATDGDPLHGGLRRLCATGYRRSDRYSCGY